MVLSAKKSVPRLGGRPFWKRSAQVVVHLIPTAQTGSNNDEEGVDRQGASLHEGAYGFGLRISGRIERLEII